MFRAHLVALAVAIGVGLIVPGPASAQTGDGTSGYASVNGLEMYYEIHGADDGGTPLVLLHGAFSTIEMFGELLPALAETRQVIAPELQGHGHTADIDRPLSYEQMADDTAELLRKLGIEQADIFGYSMGGGIALQMAQEYPDLVHKLVIAGAYFNNDGVYPQTLAFEEQMTADAFEGTPVKEAYVAVAPNPEDFDTLVAKVKELDLTFEGWTADEVQAIQVPALIVIGDAGIVRPEHAVEMLRLFGGGGPGFAGLPDSRLAILPGTSHISLINRVDWLVPMTVEFLDAPVPEAK